MEPSAATGDAPAPAREAQLPPMIRLGDLIAPKAPQETAAAGLEEGALTDLAVKLAYTVARFTTEWAGKQLHLSVPLISEVLERLCRDGLAEETMRTEAGRSHYRITQR